MGFKRRPNKTRLALDILGTDAGQKLVRQRIAAIEDEISTLDRQREALDQEHQQLAALVGSRSSTNGVRRGGKRRSISTRRVVGAIGELVKSDGKPPTRAEIASHLNTADRDRLIKPLETLIEEGVVERVGKGRGTSYRLR